MHVQIIVKQEMLPALNPGKLIVPLLQKFSRLYYDVCRINYDRYKGGEKFELDV